MTAYVTVPDGTEIEVADPVLLDYYRGVDYPIRGEIEGPASFPITFVDGVKVETPIPVAPGEYDPSAHTVDEVLEYLAGEDVTEVERARVLAVEASGKARKGIVGDDEDLGEGADDGEHPLPHPHD